MRSCLQRPQPSGGRDPSVISWKDIPLHFCEHHLVFLSGHTAACPSCELPPARPLVLLWVSALGARFMSEHRRDEALNYTVSTS